MINRLEIENFKSLKYVDLGFKALNILAGLNGMGKSSILQVLLLLRQSRETGLERILLNDGEYAEIGTFGDALYQYSSGDEIKFILHCDDREIKGALTGENGSDYLTNNEKYDKSILREMSLFNNNFQYLKAERLGPQTYYDRSVAKVIENRSIGTKGEYAVHFLNTYGSEEVVNKRLLHENSKSDTLMHQVDAWLGEISPNVRLQTDDILSINKVVLGYQFENKEDYSKSYNPYNVGFGLSYILPVVVSILASKPNDIIIIENPESHIHPKGQAKIGQLLALAAESGVQLFIETHSDHIINGIRVAVKEEVIDRNNVSIKYVEKQVYKHEQHSVVTNIRIDKQGELSEYPVDFMDEWSNQLMKLI